MKKYHLNKKEILYWANKARRFLKLPKIEIRIIEVDCAGISPSFRFDMDSTKIILSQIKKDLILDSYNKNRYNFSDKETLVFTIFHEIVHYFQFIKYRLWFEKYREGYINGLSFYSHNQQKLEVNANKIAYILYKKLYLTTLDT